MRLSGTSQLLLRLGTGFTLAFIYVPLLVVVIYAFSEARTFENGDSAICRGNA